jgi:DoxX-like family
MRRTNGILWTIQGLLALAFLFSGGMKLLTPAATLAPMIRPLPLGLIRFIGLCEMTGALGLVLPGLLRVRPRLTPIAAIGLAIIMSGAVSAMIALGRANEAVLPAVFGVLALTIASGRVFAAPLATTRRVSPRALQVAA